MRIIEVRQSVFASNDADAEQLRTQLKEEGTFLLNVMSSPGSGKTSVLLKTIERLKSEIEIGVMEADIDSDVDAVKVSETGVKTIQLHTGGMCHLDAGMTRQGLENLQSSARTAWIWPCWKTSGIWYVLLNSTQELLKMSRYFRYRRGMTSR